MMETSTDSMAQTWKPTRIKETVEKSVDLTDAPDITWQRKAKYGPGRGRPYSIRFEYVRHDGGPWNSHITIYAQRPEAIVGDFFSPNKVIDPPRWLTDLIAAATPAGLQRVHRPSLPAAAARKLKDH